MADPVCVVLYGKPECHLCEQAEAILVKATASLGVAYQKVDITGSADLFARFRYRIPVIEVAGGAEAGDGSSGTTLDWPTTAERVRRAIVASTARAR